MDEKIKILLAEDDTNLGMLLKEYLRAKGFDTVLCEDGEIAYERFLNEPFDICIFDVMMPKKDGFTLAKEVRQINSDCHYEPNSISRYCFVEPICYNLYQLQDSSFCLVSTHSGCFNFHLCGSRFKSSSWVAFL